MKPSDKNFKDESFACVRNLFSSLLILTAALLGAPGAQAEQDNKGTEFILSFLPNHSGTPNVEVHLTADAPTDVTVQYPVNAPTFNTTVGVLPGAITTVSIPFAAAQGWTANTVANNSVRLSADSEFVVYMINRMVFTSDAALGLPVDVMNTEYIVSTYNEAFMSAQFVVTGIYDDTTVTINPSNDLAGGFSAGTPFDVVLNRGEGMLLQQLNTGINGGLAGSLVSADKPIGLTNGNRCTQVPIGTAACDSIFEIAQPVQSWGTEVLVANAPDRPSGVIYRILASQDGTEVFQNGASLGVIGRGQFIEVGPLPGNHVFSANRPIFVTQFITGVLSPGATTGDPAMANFGPSEQYLNAYTFSTVGGQQFAAHYLMLIAANDDVGALLLDGVAVNAGEFSPIAGSSFSAAVVRLTEGTHSTSSSSPHGIWVIGYNEADSYSYPGGALFRFINPFGDPYPPECSSEFVPGEGRFNLLATDNRPSEDVNGNGVLDPGEDLNGNGEIDKDTGIFIVELLAGSSNLVLNVPPFVPGAGSLEFLAVLLDPEAVGLGTVKVTDGAGNSCQLVLDSSDRGCSAVDNTETFFALDGNAAHQARAASRAARSYLRNARVRKQARSLMQGAQKLYLANWTNVWSLPTTMQLCTNTALCVSVSHTSRLEDYLENSRRFRLQLADFLKRLGKAGVNTSKTRRFLTKVRRLDAQNQKLVQTVPAASQLCS